MKFFIETIGCQMNICDSDALSETLKSAGAIKVSALTDADIAIINTCSVRAQAEQKAYSWLGRAEEFKKENPHVKIAVIGCMAERIAPKIKRRFKSVNLIIGSKKIDNAAAKILQLETAKSQLPVNPGIEAVNFTTPDTVSYLTIMRGCDNYCSYCVVPFVRGREVSFDSEKIINDCKKLAANGAQEIMLLGQNVNSYKYNDVTFAKLLREIVKIKELKRLTFMTSHPKDLSDELIDAMANEPKIRKYIHLPMQSGSDKILNLMNRKYSYAHYKNLIKKLRDKVANINITSDIIVGFPGETEEDFLETLQAVEDIKFNALYIFKYSPRPNTKAAQMKDDVSLQEKKRRHNVILELAKRQNNNA
ncbi:tRNA (N6-isopentenyl adenosine(37)-C2)-methylthiotransferase MiaB [Endomicrobium proavitum]|uniref:tRNA-2-methylthio-N(6)-dimethylallyladenosine synthase n=1 Tax=Endomicrobium proavitum TaxID=1408281 RepID=A0A0G3WHP5_9BACT|nr:tRNA (N6-isopentenyl adenosine(37)-C2)-methylthiotransferase MiaB [Endomicrobium proavitum]AKL97853.1 (Dimethylallyl)adenosine tRNA methylthiotransferase MiaB [Endomicrobium proavitum]